MKIKLPALIIASSLLIHCDLMGGKDPDSSPNTTAKDPGNGKFSIYGRVALSEIDRATTRILYSKYPFQHSDADSAVGELDSTFTDSLGNYHIDGLERGDYFMTFHFAPVPYENEFFAAKRSASTDLLLDSLDGFLVLTLPDGTQSYLAEFSASGKKDMEVSKIFYRYSSSGNCRRFKVTKNEPDFTTDCSSMRTQWTTQQALVDGRWQIKSLSFKGICKDEPRSMWDISIHDIRHDSLGVATSFIGEVNGETCPYGAK
jgi:hypothetical protein